MFKPPPSGCSWPVIIRRSVVLPAPLGPMTPTTPAGGQLEREVVDEEAVAVGLAQRVGLDDHVAEPGAGRDVDLDLVELDVAVLGEQRLVRIEAGLGFGAPGRGVEAHPLQLLLDRSLAGRLLTLLLGESLLLLLQPAGVVALIRDAAAAVQLQD